MSAPGSSKCSLTDPTVQVFPSALGPGSGSSETFQGHLPAAAASCRVVGCSFAVAGRPASPVSAVWSCGGQDPTCHCYNRAQACSLNSLDKRVETTSDQTGTASTSSTTPSPERAERSPPSAPTRYIKRALEVDPTHAKLLTSP